MAHVPCGVDQSGLPQAAGRWVRQSTPEDGPAIVALMQHVGLQPHVNPEHLYWKYWRAREDWPAPRSFVLTDGTRILAHAAAVPGICRWDTARARVMHVIDWAAHRGEVGAGVMLMKHVGRLADHLLGIGGSAETLQLLPRIGFRECGLVAGYTKPLSPLALLRRPCNPRWKRGPRFARSILWATTAPRRALDGWETRGIGVEEVTGIASAFPTERPGFGIFERSEALFAHLLACPIVPMELHAVVREGRMCGYFLLSHAPGQARLADCWIDSENLTDWRALIQLAVKQAASKGIAAELVTWSSDPLLSQALRECGFHMRLQLPIYLRSSTGCAVPPGALRVQMVENDAPYLYFGHNELWA